MPIPELDAQLRNNLFQNKHPQLLAGIVAAQVCAVLAHLRLNPALNNFSGLRGHDAAKLVQR